MWGWLLRLPRAGRGGRGPPRSSVSDGPLLPPVRACVRCQPGDSLHACGGYSSVASKVFMELAHLFGWQGPAGGMPASVPGVSLCLPTVAQVRPPVARWVGHPACWSLWGSHPCVWARLLGGVAWRCRDLCVCCAVATCSTSDVGIRGGRNVCRHPHCCGRHSQG
jgi:hypothetical protein